MVTATQQKTIQPGYKLTEAGVIPDDWEIRKIGDIAEIGRGRVISHREIAAAIHSLYPVYSSQTSDEGVMGYIDTYDFEGEYVTWTTDGVKAGTVFYRNGRFNCTNVCGTIKPRRDNALYLAKVLGTLTSRYVSRNLANPKLMNDVAKQILVPLPPSVEEQSAIASTLADVDSLIALMDSLLTKNRDLKIAAMQQLLTGRRRLPGFTGSWVSIGIGEDSVLKARIGWQGLTTAEYLQSGDYYLVTGTDFVNGQINWGSCCFVDKGRYVQDTNIQLKIDDVLLTKDGTIGKVGYVDTLPGPATLNSGVFVIRPKSGRYDPRFLYYVMTSRLFDEFLAKLQAGSTISHLYQKDFVKFSFRAPSVPEQTAIADVLLDIDADIAALEARRDKARALKQGMMQQLLTGKIRLI